MKTAGIKQLKSRLSEYVRLTRAGEIILVSDRDEVVAELGLPPTCKPPSLGLPPEMARQILDELREDR